MRLPDFLIIGAAKSGTTSLHRLLSQHESFFMSNPKEIEFFSKDNKYARGPEWYGAHFSGAGEQQLCGESTSQYTFWPQYPDTFPRMSQLIPQAKLIYIMRNPIDRAYSHYAQLVKNGQCQRTQLRVMQTFEDVIGQETEVLSASRYTQQLERVLQYYPRAQCLLLLIDDLKRQPMEVLGRIERFLGIVESPGISGHDRVHANVGATHNEWFLRSRVTAPFRFFTPARYVGERLPQSWRDRAYRVLKTTPYARYIKRRYIPAPMRTETRERLIEEFRDQNERLGAMMGVDLCHWNR